MGLPVETSGNPFSFEDEGGAGVPGGATNGAGFNMTGFLSSLPSFPNMQTGGGNTWANPPTYGGQTLVGLINGNAIVPNPISVATTPAPTAPGTSPITQAAANGNGYSSTSAALGLPTAAVNSGVDPNTATPAAPTAQGNLPLGIASWGIPGLQPLAGATNSPGAPGSGGTWITIVLVLIAIFLLIAAIWPHASTVVQMAREAAPAAA